MHRVLKTRPKTRHPTILVRPKPEPDFQTETRTHPNPTVKPDKTRRVFVWLENSNFDPKSSKFSKKNAPKKYLLCVYYIIWKPFYVKYFTNFINWKKINKK